MSETDKRPLKVFLCHASADKPAVRELYLRLTKDGVDAWLDKEKLLPGQDWELEIRKAVREADVVVVCLSKQFNQAGFRQKEVRLALDTAMEKPEGEIFIIPARLEECENLESLRKWQWVDLFEDNGYERLMRALRTRADRIGAILQTKRSRKSRLEKPKAEAAILSNEVSRPLINLQPLPVEQTNPLWLLLSDLDDGQSEEKGIYIDQIEPTTYKEYGLSEVNCVIDHAGVAFKNQFSEEELQRIKKQGHLVVKNHEQGTSYLTQPWVTFLSVYSLRNVGKEAAINLLIDVSAPSSSSRCPRIISLLPGEQMNLRFLVDVLQKKVETILGKYILIVEYGDISKRYRQEYKFEIEREENKPVTFRIDLSSNQPEMNSAKQK